VIYRSQREPRLLVADMTAGTVGDFLNCGANLARYRYVCALDADATYHPTACSKRCRQRSRIRRWWWASPQA
jgi:hypothetical protein